MSNLNTINNRIMMAKKYEASLTEGANTYMGIGRPISWGASDSVIPNPTESSNSIFEVYRNLVSLKKINNSDTNLVAPRVDWSNNTVYSEYTENLELFSYEVKENQNGTVNTSISSLNVSGNLTTFTSNLSVGDFIVIEGGNTNTHPKVKKEIVSITNNEFMMVNSAFTKQYTMNTFYKVVNTYPQFSNKFYVRNTRDQVFKCLSNNSGAASTIMPEIDIGGSLPENPYIITSDGYKWKYLYTIPGGLKEKFFTSEWMPVVNDNVVTRSAVDGRLDVFKINNGGSGFLSSGNSISSNIINVVGDGTGANLTANVYNGSIVDLNIINRGSGYTRADIVLDTTLGGVNANISVVIGPMGGHGSNVEKELGATHLMICAEFDGAEDGKFPTENLEQTFDYRQLSLIRNIKDSEGLVADNTSYTAAYRITTEPPPGGTRFILDDYVYQGDSFQNATFTGVIAFWDEVNNVIWVNDTKGTLVSEGSPSLSTYSAVGNYETGAIIFGAFAPEVELYSGELLYVKNSEPILRDKDQLEQIKLVVSF